MITLGFGRRGLGPVMKQAGKLGFAAVSLGGRDVAAMIAEERNAKILAQAVDHARFHNEPLWMEKCARRLAELDPSANGQLKLASVLASLGNLQEVDDLLADIPAAERSRDSYIQTLAVLHAKQGRIDEALACFDRLAGGKQGHYPAPIVLPTAEQMIQGCPIGTSMAFIGRLRDIYPEHMLIRSMYARCLAYNGDLEQARELLAVSPHELAQAPEYERRQTREAAALILSLTGWNNELLDFARDVLAEDPTHWAMYYQASEAATFGSRRSEYDEIIGKLPAEHARTPQAIATLCRWMIDKGRIGDAKKLIEDLRSRSAWSFLSASLYLSIGYGSAEEIKQAFNDCMKCGIAPLGPATSYAMYLYYANEHRQALTLLTQYSANAVNKVSFWQFYLRCLVAADRTDEAKVLYRGLPGGLRTAARLQPFDMYFDVLEGKGAEATQAWTRYIRRSKHVSGNGRTSYPETISLRYVDEPGAVLLFSTVYNGMVYLDWFLDHYRNLGVDHFFFTDNASDDGTAERLSREPDVSLFSNADSFASSAFGIIWMNHQLQRFGVGHWCFHVDIDEGFVFPGYDRGRSLKDLLSYLDNHAFGAVAAIEVDMYPERLDAPAATNLFSAHDYFDTDYQTKSYEFPPYILIQGGIRRRLTGLMLTMTKAPLVRVSSDFRYIECNHHTTHLPVADVTAALLHYKFVGDIAKRLDEAIDRGVHFGGALAYRRLRSAANERGWGESLLSGFSRRYEGASSLEAAGLIRSSPDWEAFQPQKKRVAPVRR